VQSCLTEIVIRCQKPLFTYNILMGILEFPNAPFGGGYKMQKSEKIGFE
jgi:hypothetical protein